MPNPNPSIPQRTEWGRSSYKDIVRNRRKFIESMPFPHVTYPNEYGTWIVFQKTETSQPMLCECHKIACVKFLQGQQKRGHKIGKDKNLLNYFFLNYFHDNETAQFNKLRAETIEEFLEVPLFYRSLCHICNRRVPPVRWSNANDQSIFQQHFGWYLEVEMHYHGFSPFGDVPDKDLLSPTLEELYIIDIPAIRGRIRELNKKYNIYSYGTEISYAYDPKRREALIEIERLDRLVKEQNRKIQMRIEEIMRDRLGFPKHGRTGVSEIILLWIVKAIFPEDIIKHRTRPDFLNGLELDIFMPSRRLAIEYQGEQHYLPLKHLGGAEYLESVKERDSKKYDLCKEHQVQLIYFDYSDALTEDHVRKKLQSK